MLRELCVLPVLLLLAATARAEEPPEPIDDQIIGPWDHFEVSMGFLAGQRGYRDANFSLSNGANALDLMPSLDAAPFDRVNVFGLRYDARLVVSYLRMTTGFDFPFATYRSDTVRSLRPYELRFGIGAEYPIGPIAPFVDLIGGVHWVDTKLGANDVEAQYSATSFAFSVRSGVRVHVRRWFFAAAAGELGLTGDIRWGAELSVGFALL
jgi:hypothetical protein